MQQVYVDPNEIIQWIARLIDVVSDLFEQERSHTRQASEPEFKGSHPIPDRQILDELFWARKIF
ncbi:MAG: hypothetical protein EB051_05910 [Chlamydiia bacterium]|nr:hypothetical protein [Chlamydiia bacterium]